MISCFLRPRTLAQSAQGLSCFHCSGGTQGITFEVLVELTVAPSSVLAPSSKAGAPSSVLAPSSDALCSYKERIHLMFLGCCTVFSVDQ